MSTNNENALLNKPARLAKFENLKFFLIICVVAGHFLSRVDDLAPAKSLILFIYSFHMPGFIFASGLFAKRTIDEKRYDKIFSFFILFAVLKIVPFIARLLSGVRSSFNFFEMGDVAWYAFAVFVFYLMTIFFKQFSPVYMLVASVAFACMAGYAKDIETFLSLSRIVVFYPIFLLGYYIKPEDVIKVTNKIYIKLLSLVVIVATAVISVVYVEDIYWILKLFKGKVPYAFPDGLSNYGAFLRLIWYAVSMLIVFAWIAVIPNKRCIFTSWGGRTLQVYALHYALLVLFFDWFEGKKFLKNIWPEHYVILVVLLAVAVTCILSVKPIKVVMDKIVYPKKRIKELQE